MKRLFWQFLAMALLMLPALCHGQSSTRQYLSPNTFYYDFHLISQVGPTEFIDLRSIIPSNHTISTKVTGTPSVCDFVVEGSSDGVLWASISTTHSCTTYSMFHIAYKPVRYLRVRVVDLTGTANLAFQWTAGVK
jgi:hypothetical protein